MARSKKETISRLVRLGLKRSLAMQIHNYLGNSADTVVEQNPYVILQYLESTNWSELDQLAHSLGFQESCPERYGGAVLHTLRASVNDGHVFLPQKELYQRISRLINNGEKSELDHAIEHLIENKDIVGKEESVYLQHLYRAERQIARCLKTIYDSKSKKDLHEPDAHQMRQVERELNIQLAEAQYEAVKASTTNKIMIITGGPGTGKTTIIRAILHLWEKFGVKFLLAAPTGRAAKRMRESTGRNRACTIHRLLEYSQDAQAFQRNANRKLKADLLIVDESSMIDTELMACLLEALPDHTHIVFVGDVDQLPAVGPGYVLHDMIKSDCFKTVHLQEIFRQTNGSLISLNAKQINEGILPAMEGEGIEKGQDFFFIQRNDPHSVQEAIVEMVTNRIPKQFDLNPKEDVQVLSPMYKHPGGVDSLNQCLQEKMTPSDNRMQGPFYSFAIGDKVMQIRNDYSKDVYNGDIGFIVGIDPKEKQVMLEFEGVEKVYAWDELDATSLAYAITVHKSQGSEYAAVVMPLLMKHYPMLQRNLLYTAVSRGKQLVVIVGQKRALQIAIENNKIRRRHTALQKWLREEFGVD